MLLTPHILTGAAIASNISNPVLGLFLAFLSHYFLDIIPHQEYDIKNIKEKNWQKSFFSFLKVFLDATLGILVIFFLSGTNVLIFAAAFLAILPDGLTLLFLFLPENKLFKKYETFHLGLHSFIDDEKIPVFWGVFSQIAVISIAIFFLL